jgi:hypothetical protein
MFCLITDPKIKVVKGPWTKTSEIVSQNKRYLGLSWFSPVFWHSYGKLTNTMILIFYSLDRSGIVVRHR